MSHRDIERWYRLRLLKKAAMAMVGMLVVSVVLGFAISQVWTRTGRQPWETLKTDSGIGIADFTYSFPGPHPWELAARMARASDTLDQVTLERPRVTYHLRAGDKITVTAEQGKLDRETGRFSASGGVRINFRDFLFSAEDLHYSDETHVAKTASNISLEATDFSLKGRGLRVSIDEEEVQIENEVEAVLYNVSVLEPTVQVAHQGSEKLP
jgi:LPS export ABC transporter protein LptC